METAPKGKIEQLDLHQAQGVEAIIATLKRVEKLGPGERLVITLAGVPFQLYDLLQQRGFLIKYEPREGGLVLGLIERKGATAENQAV